jgi:hypothetical protein
MLDRHRVQDSPKTIRAVAASPDSVIRCRGMDVLS